MVNTLVVIIMLAALVLGTRYVVHSVELRLAKGKHFRQTLDDAHTPQDVRDTLHKIEQHEKARKRTGSHTSTRPRLSREQKQSLRIARKKARDAYLDETRPGLYHYVIIFVIASFLGLVIEMTFMAITSGRTESRVGLVWGPFSPLYGFGACLLTMVLWNFRHSPWYQVFFVSSVLGGGLEQLTGMLMNYFGHAQSWTYIGLPDALTQWIAWRFLIMWGFIGLFWSKIAMPEIIYRIGEPTSRMQVFFIGVLTAALILDMCATLYCFYRKGQRDAGVAPANIVDVYVDKHFSNEFIEDRFENLVVDQQLAPNA